VARQTWLPSRVLPGVAPVAATAERAARRAASDRARLAVVLLIALCQGVLFLCLLPPWQHYDEPTHFEYAWLIANRTGLPSPGDEDQAMRRELAATMLASGFYQDIAPPTLLTDTERIEVGVTELLHPPAYYMLISLPLRLARHLDLVSQLYVARAASLALFVLTIAVVAGLMRELTRPGHHLRWAVPLSIALLPAFADLMTAVNNDVGAVAVFSLFLWGAVRMIRRGPTWPRLVWVFGTALLATATKNTAAVALALALLACLIVFWMRRGWRWRSLAATAISGVVALSAAALGWGDAAAWYRGGTAVQSAPTRATVEAAPVGAHALALELPAGDGLRTLTNPVVGYDEAQLVGKTVTIGGWVWAERPATARIGMAFKTPETAASNALLREVPVSAAPSFVAWTVVVPEQASALYYRVVVAADATAPVRMYLDGAVLAVGTFPANTLPAFDDEQAAGGTWGGARFTNLLRNPSAERAWPRLRAWVDDALFAYIHRSPAQAVAAFFDIERIAPAVLPYMIQPAFDSFVQMFAWSNVRLSSPIWRFLSYCVALLALLGCLRRVFKRRQADAAHVPTPGHAPAIAFLALVGVLVWVNTILRPLPLLGEQYVIPIARYTFPAIAATMLGVVGGWWALWPRALRAPLLLVFVGALVVLDAAAVATIWSYYHGMGAA
jgi:hypothetical protein